MKEYYDRRTPEYDDWYLGRGRWQGEVRPARRVAPQLVVVDASRSHAHTDAERQHRVLNDGSRWQVYKRYFTPDGLLAKVGGDVVLHHGRWFVAVRSP